MKFRELPVGATFRFFVRGRVLQKTSEKTYGSDETGVRNQAAELDVGVIPEQLEPGHAPAPEDPYGETNEVEFSKKAVRLEGVFTINQLEAVIAQMRKGVKK